MADLPAEAESVGGAMRIGLRKREMRGRGGGRAMRLSCDDSLSPYPFSSSQLFIYNIKSYL